VCSGFFKEFKFCMDGLGLPVPTTLFQDLVSAVATLKSIADAVRIVGQGATIGRLIELGFLDGVFTVVAGVIASFYLGACIGCVIAATATTCPLPRPVFPIF
jgi:hypothetical protein